MTKLAIGADLAVQGPGGGVGVPRGGRGQRLRGPGWVRGELAEAGLPFVMALKPRHGTWAYGADADTPPDAARALAWDGPDDPGDWRPVVRTFRDGRTQTWYAADATLGWWGPDGFSPRPCGGGRRRTRAPCPGQGDLVPTPPTCPGPAARAGADSPHPAAGLAEIVRIYGIRHWIEQGYKRSKTSWAGPTSRSAPTPRCTGIRPWSTARSASAGPPGSLISRRSATVGRRGRTRPRREGGRARPYRRRRRPGPGRCGRYAPGFPLGSRCSASGRHGAKRPRRRSCKP